MPPMGSLDRIYEQRSEHISFESGPIQTKERGARLLSSIRTADVRRGNSAALELVYQVAEIIEGVENQAAEIEKTSHQQLQFKQERIEELETELRTAQLEISETRAKLKELEEVARAGEARLEAAENRMSELETRAETAEAQTKEKANALFRIEEAIRTQILSKRLPANNLASSA
jgi:chromosome segregation ATPase